MPKNALFLLKNRKNRRTLGAPPPDPLASGGLCPQTLIGLRRLEASPPDPCNSLLPLMTNSWLRACVPVML